MRDYHEELWRQLPPDLTPPDLDLRSDFLRAVLRAGDRVLDLGCGEGTFTALAIEAGARSALGADIAEAALERARAAHPALSFQRIEPDRPLPLPDNSFELVWASEVIEHVADTGVWLSEVRRVLVPSGRLAITTPDHSRLRVLLGGIERYSPPLGDHLHLYTRRSLRELLSEFGFGEITVQATGAVPLMHRLLLASAQR